ncbi:RICIN domain-containing protein [Archangium sp.]|uniref:RICIN domain-containing protein n=1 Tax=Archangium sp. TaxID=1872627 RepID=UPI0039C89F6C
MLLAAIGCGGVAPESREAQPASDETQPVSDENSRAALSLSDRLVIIRAKHSWQYLDVEGASYNPGAHLIQHPCNGGDNQQFRIE